MRKEMEQQVFGSLFLLANRLQAQGDKLSGELTLKQWMLLLLLIKRGDEAWCVNDAAALLGTTRQNTKKMLELLEKKEFIQMKPSQRDGRALSIRPTPRAYAFFRENQELGNTLLSRVFQGVDDSSLETMVTVLKQLRNNLSGEAEV